MELVPLVSVRQMGLAGSWLAAVVASCSVTSACYHARLSHHLRGGCAGARNMWWCTVHESSSAGPTLRGRRIFGTFKWVLLAGGSGRRSRRPAITSRVGPHLFSERVAWLPAPWFETRAASAKTSFVVHRTGRVASSLGLQPSAPLALPVPCRTRTLRSCSRMMGGSSLPSLAAYSPPPYQSVPQAPAASAILVLVVCRTPFGRLECCFEVRTQVSELSDTWCHGPTSRTGRGPR